MKFNDRDPYFLATGTICADGWRISIQASRGHYCQPRCEGGMWYQLELGYPSAVEPLLLPYAETPGEPLETVYGYVPREVVLAALTAHGGPVIPAELRSKEDHKQALILEDLGYDVPALKAVPRG